MITQEQKDRIEETGLDYGGVAVIPRKEIKAGHLRVEYLAKDGNLIIHFFWEQPHPTQQGTRSLGEGFPEQPIYAPWPETFREVAWGALRRHFRLESKDGSVDVSWVPELFSYDATVKSICQITEPSNSSMTKLVNEISELIS